MELEQAEGECSAGIDPLATLEFRYVDYRCGDGSDTQGDISTSLANPSP